MSAASTARQTRQSRHAPLKTQSTARFLARSPCVAMGLGDAIDCEHSVRSMLSSLRAVVLTGLFPAVSRQGRCRPVQAGVASGASRCSISCARQRPNPYVPWQHSQHRVQLSTTLCKLAHATAALQSATQRLTAPSCDRLHTACPSSACASLPQAAPRSHTYRGELNTTSWPVPVRSASTVL